MKTYFAIPQRETREVLEQQIKMITTHDLIKSLMKIVRGLFAVLNDKRQIIAVNNSFADALELQNEKDILGYRLGETVHCVNANLMEGGCGTSKYCSSCGAAISMVSSLENSSTAEQICSIRAQTNGSQENIYFKVKSAHIDIYGKSFVLIFLEDITYSQKMAELERVFFHDIFNKVSGIINGCEILKYQSTENTEIVQIIYDLTYQMVREIDFQRKIVKNENNEVAAEIEIVTLKTVYNEIDRVFSNHSVKANKLLTLPLTIEKIKFYSDIAIIIRVLTNMIKNALEATPKGGEVKVYHEISEEYISMYVWNEGFIEPKIARQIFKRNFTTKKGSGHGFGTFSMKLLGEEILGGKISFDTSPETGTTFRFDIPNEKP
ncbi:MAG: sensor histidine kinase [Fidelibacterota bacterium]